MHPKEYRREKCATGRLACLNLADSEIIHGLCVETNERFRELLNDKKNFPVLLYPGTEALDLSSEGFSLKLPEDLRLVVFLIDATWSCARSLMRLNPSLQALPKMMFRPKNKSRFVIKRQPASHCLSTIEAIHELLLCLDAAGLETYSDRSRLLGVFDAMQDYQIEAARSSGRARYALRKEYV